MRPGGSLRLLAQHGLMGAVVLVLLLGCATNGAQRSIEKVDGPKGGFQLVGVGPGDGDLLTPRAVGALHEADVVLCDTSTQAKLAPYVSLAGKQVLDGHGDLAPFHGVDCSRLPEGSRSRDGMHCEEYHRKRAELATLVRTAVAAGKKVVMTSGGDPAMYGADAWILQELRELSPTVVAGMSALNAANGALQVSLGEVIITDGSDQAGRKDTVESLAGHERATMVIFRPRDVKALVARLAKIRPGGTPVAVVSHAGSRGGQKIVTGTLKSINRKIQAAEDELSLVYVGKSVGEAPSMMPGQKRRSAKGKFYLVGVGPGDPDLASLRALKVIDQADVIFAGNRIGDRFARQLEGKKVIDGYHRLFPFYGKKCSQLTEAERARETMSCEEYHRKQAEFASMVREAVAKGQTVAMLDNGDPLIYGPCAWTLTELRDLDTEVIPGLSAFNAANAALRADVTGGRSSRSVLLASGWSVDEMAAHRATMALFTMRTEFKQFIDSLSKHYPPDTPVAIVSSAGFKDRESVMRATLGTVLGQVGETKLPFEYLLYVGDFLSPQP